MSIQVGDTVKFKEGLLARPEGKVLDVEALQRAIVKWSNGNTTRELTDNLTIIR